MMICYGVDTVMDLLDFKARNKFSFQRYWAQDKAAGLDLNRAFEKRQADIETAAEAVAA